MTTAYDLTPDWNAANRYDVTTAATLLMTNTSAYDIRWARTADIPQPLLDPQVAAMLRSGESISLSIPGGQSLWLAAHPRGSVAVDVFPYTGQGV